MVMRDAGFLFYFLLVKTSMRHDFLCKMLKIPIYVGNLGYLTHLYTYFSLILYDIRLRPNKKYEHDFICNVTYNIRIRETNKRRI